jgi:hypothetical protein
VGDLRLESGGMVFVNAGELQGLSMQWHPFFDCNPAIHWHPCLHCNRRCSNLKLWFVSLDDLCTFFPSSLHLSNSCFLSLCFWTCGSVHIAMLELHTLKWLLCLVQCHVYLCWACWAC